MNGLGAAIAKDAGRVLALAFVATFTAGCLFAWLVPELWHWIVPIIHEWSKP